LGREKRVEKRKVEGVGGKHQKSGRGRKGPHDSKTLRGSTFDISIWGCVEDATRLEAD
jgi:hypothetical protein